MQKLFCLFLLLCSHRPVFSAGSLLDENPLTSIPWNIQFQSQHRFLTHEESTTDQKLNAIQELIAIAQNATKRTGVIDWETRYHSAFSVISSPVSEDWQKCHAGKEMIKIMEEAIDKKSVPHWPTRLSAAVDIIDHLSMDNGFTLTATKSLLVIARDASDLSLRITAAEKLSTHGFLEKDKSEGFRLLATLPEE